MTSPRPACCIDLGMIPFDRAHSLQLDIVGARVSGKIEQDVILLMEHPPVFTLGRRGSQDSLKVSSSVLKQAGMELFHIERGGDITFHGPGQLVLYPILQLREAGLGVVDFVEKLEGIMLKTARDMGVIASRDTRNHGIWVDNRKLGFVGIAVRHSTSFHGIALNVSPPLEPFTWIDPCGLKNIQVTTLNRETGRTVKMDAVKGAIRKHFENMFSVSLEAITTDQLKEMIN